MPPWLDMAMPPNILLVQYADLLDAPKGQFRRIAKHLDIAIDEEMLPGILERISFQDMKDSFHMIMPEADHAFREGEKTFMNKGTNGRWQGVLTEEEMRQCRGTVERELTPDCAEWLEKGGAHRI